MLVPLLRGNKNPASSFGGRDPRNLLPVEESSETKSTVDSPRGSTLRSHSSIVDAFP